MGTLAHFEMAKFVRRSFDQKCEEVIILSDDDDNDGDHSSRKEDVCVFIHQLLIRLNLSKYNIDNMKLLHSRNSQ